MGARRSGSAESGDCGDGLANCCGTCFNAGDDDEERKEAVAIAFTWGDVDCPLVYSRRHYWQAVGCSLLVPLSEVLTV